MTTETTTLRPLTKLEKRSVEFWMEILADAAFEKLGGKVESAEELYQALKWAAADNGPMLPKLLAALTVEHVIAGDRNWGESDPPEDLLLGPVIDTHLRRALAIAKLHQPTWYRHMVE